MVLHSAGDKQKSSTITPMIKAQERSPNPSVQSSAKAQAETAPVRQISALIFTLDDNGLLSPVFTFKLPVEQWSKLEEAITEAVEELPEAKTEIGRPSTKLIVTAINKQDKDYKGGENALDLGEVISVPELVSWFNVDPDDKTSAPLLRYYLKRHQPFEKYGYTLHSLEDFKRNLNGPVKKDFYAVAEAHCAWAKANRVTPLE
jgi:hypothetical protein